MADAPPERGRFYRFTHYAAESFPYLPVLRVHRHTDPPEGQDPPPLADLHPGDVVEVASVQVLAPGDLDPNTGTPVTETTEVAIAVNHPHLEPILQADASEANLGAAYVQDLAVPSSPAIAVTVVAPTELAADVTPPAAELLSTPEEPTPEKPAEPSTP